VTDVLPVTHRCAQPCFGATSCNYLPAAAAGLSEEMLPQFLCNLPRWYLTRAAVEP
jgi:hypothetical protein